MFLLRLLLVACALLGPTAAGAVSLVAAEEEAAEVGDEVAVERRTVACQPPLPGPTRKSPGIASRGRVWPAPALRVRAPHRQMRERLVRRLMFADGDGDSDGDDDNR
jgi:hypothetical protein